VEKVNDGAGVVVLTDMFGGSPSNLAIAIIVKVIAGVNLPMLVKIASIRKMLNLGEAVARAQEAGKKYINIASQLLIDNKTRGERCLISRSGNRAFCLNPF
jgi:PTS system mannose-specific IIA component